MFLVKRAAILLAIGSFCLTLLILRFQNSVPIWRTLAQTVRMGDLNQNVSGDSALPMDDIGRGYQDDIPWDRKTPLFNAGTLNEPGYNYSRALVVAKTQEEDVSWMDEVDLGPITKMIYEVDNRKAKLRVPKNKGHEGMAYLTYIIDHYDDLPDVSLFMHAHRYAWHNNEILSNDAAQMISRLSSEKVVRDGYFNLRCHWMPGCPEWVHPGVVDATADRNEEPSLAQAFTELFPGRPIPKVLAQPCCAQFALSRQRIRAIPKERFEFYRQWLLRTPLSDSISGRVWEYMWQVAFTGETSWCPSQWVCYCDGYGVCFKSEEHFEYWFELQWKQRYLQEELGQWNKAADRIEEYRQQNGGFENIEASNLVIPEAGKNAELDKKILDMQSELDWLRDGAIEHGKSAKVRASVGGRLWTDGDGY